MQNEIVGVCEMIRVLQVIHSMNLGGAENFIMNVYRNIDRSRVQFDFLVNENGTFDEEISKLGGHIWIIPYVSQAGPWKYHMELTHFFQNHEYRVVHSHLDMVSGEVIECAKKAGVPYCITHSHNTDTTGNWLVKKLKEYYQRKILLYADVRMACSEQAGKWLYGNNNSIVINNAIDLEKFQFQQDLRTKIRKLYEISENTMVLGHVGRYSKVKNHDFLLKVFEAYHQKHSNSKLLLCGNGDLKEAIREQVVKKKLQNQVIFFDASTDVYKMYNMMDVFVFPSLYEGMSLAMLEAQANGLPIVASDSVDSRSAVTDSVVFLSLNEGMDNWVNAIEHVERDVCNCGLQKLQEAGYDIKQVAGQLMKYYEQGNQCEISN